jgi:phage-related protein (TIGR01555 family)
LTRYSAALGYSNAILRDFIQAVLSVKDLTAMISAGKEDTVTRRMRLLEMSRSILNTMVIDADGEEYTKSASSVTGIPDVIDRFAEHICACTGIPMARLFGRSPGGLNSTGEHDESAYYDTLAGEQERLFSPLAEFVVRLVFNAKDGPTSGNEPETWSVVWRSLDQPTDKETADLRKVVAETDQIYIAAGVLSPMEVAESRYGQGEWSMDTQLASETERNEVASEAPEDVAARELEAAKAAPPAEPVAQ